MAGARKMRPAFYALHAATLNPATTTDQLAAALRATEEVQDRHRLAEGAVYASGCRRWLLDTGTDWKATQQAAGAASWGGQSSHRLRTRDDDGATAWACSCGTTGVAGTEALASKAHYAHVQQATTVTA